VYTQIWTQFQLIILSFLGDRAIVVGLCWCDIQASSQTDWSPQWFRQPFSSDQFGFVAPVQSCYRSTWRYGCACKQYLVVDYIQELHSYLTYVPPRCSSSWIDCYWVPALCSEGGMMYQMHSEAAFMLYWSLQKMGQVILMYAQLSCRTTMKVPWWPMQEHMGHSWFRS